MIYTTMVASMMTSILALIVMFMAIITAKKTYFDREKNSPFECGFDPKSSSRMPFSLQFFLIAVIFLIFDVEITLLVPFIMILKISSCKTYILTLFTFLFILLMGLFHEWNQGALNWSI
uniref:NADH-ubiquinone oxidoreductase chain 3 n=1 Tax=Staphylinidae sp. BMNH 1274206 TaxID=1796557 RepID=A0A140EGR7_9COLE|nr:NADH dehydrogenase subunit 3 [Staphylinidae sp. BMNH 1274206]